MVLVLSDLGPRCCENRDLPAQRRTNDQDKTGYIWMKKHQHPRTEEDGGDDQDNTEFSRKKKVKKSSPETEADYILSDHSCFVALVKASNLQNDALDLPKDVISSNGLRRKCSKIVIIYGGERSWALDLSFNKSSDTFYISRGWRNFCDENGQKAGGFFMFELVGNGETPVLSFCPAESTNDGTTGDNKNKNKKQKECCIELGKEKNRLSQNRYVTLTLTNGTFTHGRLHLPLSFMSENGLDKRGMITLLGKDGTKWRVNRLREQDTGRMSLGKGWRKFAIANGLKTGGSFTLESIWQDTTPMLRLFRTYSSSDKRHQGEYCSKASEKEPGYTELNSGNKTRKAKSNRDERSSKELVRNKCLPYRRASLSPKDNRFVTLTLTRDSLITSRLGLPLSFTRENGLDKPRLITLLGKDGAEWVAYLRWESTGGRLKLGKGWKEFAEANGLKIGESFTLESICKDATTMLSLSSTQSKSDRRQQGEDCSNASEKKSVSTEPSSEILATKAKNNKEENRDPSSAIHSRFVTLTLTHEDVKDVKLVSSSNNSYSNGLKTGESFTLESIWQDTTPMLSLFHTDSSSDNRFVTLTLGHRCFTKAGLGLPLRFMRENGLDKPRLITLLGKNGTKWVANLCRESTGGRMRLGKGWKEFAKAHGLKMGESITLESIWKDETPMLSLFCTDSSSDKRQEGEHYSETNEKESVSTEPSSEIMATKAKNNEKESVSTEPSSELMATKAKNNEKESVSIEPSSELMATKAKNNKEENRDPSSAILNRIVTLTLTHEDVKEVKLILPSHFMKANDINRLGKITMLGKNRMECSGYLLSRDGVMALGDDWIGFCEAHGVKTGDSFTLEFVYKQETTPVLKFSSNSRD